MSTVAAGDPVVLSTGHQAFTVAPASAVHRLPSGVGLREAAISYLCSWSVSALHLGRYRAAETVVVVGQGLVGASAALVADAMGARVLALDVDPVRVAFARGLGLGAVEQPGRLARRSGSRRSCRRRVRSGPTSSSRPPARGGASVPAIELARDYTRIAVMGIYREPPPPDLGLELFGLLNAFPSKFHYRRLNIIGVGSDPDVVVPPAPHLATRASNWQWVLWQAARGRLPLGRLITDTLPPAEIGSALERLSARQNLDGRRRLRLAP